MQLRIYTIVIHAWLGVRGAGAFVASFAPAPTAATQATKRCRSYTTQKSRGYSSATRGNKRQNGGAFCPESAVSWSLLRLASSHRGNVPATVGTSGSSPVTRAPTAISTGPGGILASLMKTAMNRGGDSDTVLYFSFGANMCPSVLTNKRGVQPLASLPVEALRFSTNSGLNATSVLNGCEHGELCLCFCHRAGYATLREKPGPPQTWETSPGAHGVVHAISSADLDKIAAYENGYRKRLVEVKARGGDRDIAFSFVSIPSQTLPTSVPPTSRYLALLQDGAAHHGVDERYRSWLAQLPSVRPEEEATSPDRISTPSKFATDAVVAAIGIAALGAAFVALSAP